MTTNQLATILLNQINVTSKTSIDFILTVFTNCGIECYYEQAREVKAILVPRRGRA